MVLPNSFAVVEISFMFITPFSSKSPLAVHLVSPGRVWNPAATLDMSFMSIFLSSFMSPFGSHKSSLEELLEIVKKHPRSFFRDYKVKMHACQMKQT